MTDPVEPQDTGASGDGGAARSPAPAHPERLAKAEPPPLMGRAPRPGAVRIRKPVVQAVVLGAALLLSGSLAWAFIIQPDLRARARAAVEDDRIEAARGGVRPSDRVTGQPASYDRLSAAGPLSEAGTLPEPRTFGLDAADGEPETAPARVPQPDYPPPRQAMTAPRSVGAEAAASGLFFEAGSVAPAPQAQSSGPPSSAGPHAGAAAAEALIYSPHGLASPVSPYELKAGTLIPGILLTAVDTARPGPVVAIVSQNVFDSITGRHLLLPQGARLLGRHEGETRHGQQRAFLVWDRLILPNGKSLLLAGEPGVDGLGAVGLPGRTDRRLWPLGVASLFAGAVSTLGELARGGSRDQGRSLMGSAGDAASIEAAQVGGRLIDRELQVQPSIRVEAGAPVRVMITRDLTLEPYVR